MYIGYVVIVSTVIKLRKFPICVIECLEYHRTVHANITIERVNGMTVEHRETVCPSMGYAVPIGGPETKLWDYPHTVSVRA